MSTDTRPHFTDRQARALIAAAEPHGFEREPHLIWWRYDETLHTDAEAAFKFLEVRHPEETQDALTAPDPMPTWVAVERITNERGGLNFAQARPLIDAAVARGLMTWAPRDSGRFDSGEWPAAGQAIALLWESDPASLKEVLGNHVRIALLPETAMYPCPSVCDHGWVRHKFAGELPSEPPHFISCPESI